MEREFSVDRALKEVDGITSLETARMTLRWALERLRLLESRLETAQSSARESAAAAENATHATDELRRERDHARKEAARVSALVARLETRFSELGRGGVSAAALARRETELAERAEDLTRREARNRELAEGDRLTVEQEARAARERAEREAKAQLALEREELHRAHARAAEEISARFISLHEDEVRLRVRQKTLEERSLTLEGRAESQRTEIEKAAATQVAMLQNAAKAHLEAEVSALQQQWAAERELLLDELTSWRARARSMIPEVVSLGDRLHAAEEEDSSLKTALDRAAGDAQRTESALQEERDHHRLDAGSLFAARAEAADHARRAEELSAALRAQSLRTEEVAKARDDLAAALAKREEALVRLEDNLTARILDAEKLLIARYDAWTRHEAASRREGNAWLTGIEDRRRQADAALEHIGRLRQELIEEIAKRRTPSEQG